MLADILASEAK